MKKITTILLNLLSGAIGGALVVLFLANNPNAAKLFTPNQPAITGTNTSIPETTQNQPIGNTSDESRVVAAVNKANPAVVSIVITKDVPIIEQYVPQSPMNPFNDFFGGNMFSPFSFGMPQYRQNGTQKQEVGGGSGFLVSPDGLIITNQHVVSDNNAEYTVFLNDGTKYNAKVLARDSASDLAVIKIDASNLRYLDFANSDELKVGQTVIAIGNALGEFRNTVSVGVISGLSRSITAGDGQGQSEQLEGVIQTDAAINPGNSGGPLLNISGQVIGVNVAIASGSENIGFALPANLAKDTTNSVKETGKIVRPYIGVRYTDITPGLVAKNNLSVDYGALVIRGSSPDELAVVPGSPADKAGIKEGDIILEVDSKKLTSKASLASVIRQHKVGDSLTLKMLSQGQEKTVTVTLAEAKQ